MWLLAALLSLLPPGYGVPLHTRGPPEHARNTSSHGLQPPRTSPAPPVTPTLLPTHSEAPALSLNLGLNFKIKVRSQGKSRPGEGPGGGSAKPGQPPTWPAAPAHSQAPGSPLWAEALGGSGWPAPGPAEELPSGPGGWTWGGSPPHATPGLPATPGGAPQPPLLLWPGLARGALGGPTGEDSKELEFKIDIDLTAGLGKESGLAPNGSGGAPPGNRYALLPGLRVGLSGVAGELPPPGLFGATLPLGPRGPPEGGTTDSTGEQPADWHPTLAWLPGPGNRPRNATAWPGEMDASRKPHRIPPVMALYAERHSIFQLMQGLTEALLVHRPEAPIDFMIEHLKKDNDEVPRVFVLGPPASGKTTIARWLCKHLSAVYLCPQQLLSLKLLKRSTEAMALRAQEQPIPEELWASLLEERLADVDCVKLGWVLDGFPETRKQALWLQAAGIAPRHVLVLRAPDEVLAERNLGRRVDPLSQEVYHTTFDWPIDFTVQKRLVQPEGTSVPATARRLLDSHRHLPGLLRTYAESHKLIDADQPCADVFAQALNFVQSRARSDAPFVPRVLLLGPPGSGKSLQAALLHQKYGLVNIFFGDLLREQAGTGTALGELIRPSLESGVPVSDSVVLRVLRDRLAQQDCLARGWVLHGFPRDLDQADVLRHTGYEPNRVFILRVPTDVAMGRVCQRATDPVSGERYHTVFRPPTDEGVHQRLRRNPRDAPERVERKADFYRRQAAELEEYYSQAVCLNADQDPYTVFEYIESCLVKPLPVTSR